MKITDINKAMSVCFKHRVKVYHEKGYIYYQVNNSKPKKFNKQVSKDDINNAITKSYLHLANKL